MPAKLHVHPRKKREKGAGHSKNVRKDPIQRPPTESLSVAEFYKSCSSFTTGGHACQILRITPQVVLGVRLGSTHASWLSCVASYQLYIRFDADAPAGTTGSGFEVKGWGVEV